MEVLKVGSGSSGEKPSAIGESAIDTFQTSR